MVTSLTETSNETNKSFFTNVCVLLFISNSRSSFIFYPKLNLLKLLIKGLPGLSHIRVLMRLFRLFDESGLYSPSEHLEVAWNSRKAQNNQETCPASKMNGLFREHVVGRFHGEITDVWSILWSFASLNKFLSLAPIWSI